MTPLKKIVLVSLSFLCAAGLVRSLTETAKPGSGTGAPPSGPAHFGFAGNASCSARACHGGDTPVAGAVAQQNEYTTSLLHDKHVRAYSVLLEPRARTIARNLAERTGQRAVAAHEDWRCLACHATPQSAWEQSQGKKVDLATANWQLGGVGCEACHGPSRTDKPYLELHTSPELWRNKFKDAAEKSQYHFENLADPARQASVCAGCHVGAPPDEKNKIPARDCNHDIMASGHPRLNFELTVFRANMPPHWNVQLKEKEDSTRLWLLGRVASAKASVDLLAWRAESASKDTEKARWPEFAEFRCYACHKDLNTDWRGAKNEANRLKGSFPYDSWYSTQLSTLNPALADGYGKLRSLMATGGPDAAQVKKQAKSLSAELETWLKKPFKADETLKTILAANPRLPGDWEDAMQLTLTLAALRKSDVPQALLDMAKALSFPEKREGPKGIEFPARIEAAQKAYAEFLKSVK